MNERGQVRVNNRMDYKMFLCNQILHRLICCKNKNR